MQIIGSDCKVRHYIKIQPVERFGNLFVIWKVSRNLTYTADFLLRVEYDVIRDFDCFLSPILKKLEGNL